MNGSNPAPPTRSANSPASWVVCSPAPTASTIWTSSPSTPAPRRRHPRRPRPRPAMDAVACRVLTGLNAATPLLAGIGGEVLVDVDDTIIEVHGHAKQGAGFGYCGVRGINALISTITVADRAPVIAASRLRKGSTGSPRGAARLVADTLATLRRLRGKGAGGRVLLRADSAFYAQPVVHAAQRARGAGVDHAAAEQTRQGRDRHHRRGCVDADPVHRRDPRRTDRAVDLPRRGRRNSLHRFHFPPQRSTGDRPVGGPTHPGPQRQKGATQNPHCSTFGGSTRSSQPPRPRSPTP